MAHSMWSCGLHLCMTSKTGVPPFASNDLEFDRQSDADRQVDIQIDRQIDR